MSKEKVAEIAALAPPQFAAYKSKRNQRTFWRTLSHKEWAAFCKIMGKWFASEATDEWDNYIIANDKRKAESDIAALARKNGR